MKKMRGYIPTVGLIITIAFGSIAAQAGIIITDNGSTGDEKKTCEKKVEPNLFTDILTKAATFALSGIIITDNGSDDDQNETCGIIIVD